MHRETFRTIETENFSVEIFTFPEDIDPADTVAFGDDEESQQAERAYLDRIYRGDLPWVVIGARVLSHGNELGAAYLGGCDFLPCSDGYGREVARQLVTDAIEDARHTASSLLASLSSLRS